MSEKWLTLADSWLDEDDGSAAGGGRPGAARSAAYLHGRDDAVDGPSSREHDMCRGHTQATYGLELVSVSSQALCLPALGALRAADCAPRALPAAAAAAAARHAGDCFQGNLNETGALEVAAAIKKYLLPSGYDTLTIDEFW